MTTTRPRAAIYCRLADAGQAADERLAAQERACRRYAAAHGYAVHEGHVYREVDAGLTLAGRPQLDALRAAISRREVDAVIVDSPDRLSMDLVALGVIADECERAGVEVAYARGGEDEYQAGPGTSAGEQQQGWVAP